MQGLSASPLPQAPSPVPQNRPGRWFRLPRSRPRRALFLSVYLAFCVGLVFLAGKLFWRFRAGVPLTDVATVYDYYYPEIRRSQVQAIHPRHDDGVFDVLVLGGSALIRKWGNVEDLLRERLRQELGDRFRVYNLAESAHTTRDSLIKYRYLAAEQFDLVIVYDGINDVRLNCCPRELYRDDYSHFQWYKAMQAQFDAGALLSQVELARPVELVATTFRFDSKNVTLLEEAREIKTVAAVRNNLGEIADTAADRGDTLLLMTYACYIPVDYAQEKFKNRSLDYTFRDDDHGCDVETWGKPAYVAAALAAQNDAIRSLAREHAGALFVDQTELMPGKGRLFADPCHLTDAGGLQFVENLWPAVSQRLEKWKATHSGR